MGRRKLFGFHLRDEDDRKLYEFLDGLPQRSDWLLNAARMAYAMQQLGIQVGQIHTPPTSGQSTVYLATTTDTPAAKTADDPFTATMREGALSFMED